MMDGVGLGLTICRAIVRAHGGRIAVREPQGAGPLVEFTLPVASPIQVWSGETSEVMRVTGRPMVLVVEDDRDMRKVLRVALSGRGYDVVEAATGAQALLRFREAPPNVMILDLGLPDIDGVEVAAYVRKQHELPIIVLSARGEEEHHIKALDAGANDYVTEPFRRGRADGSGARCATLWAAPA